MLSYEEIISFCENYRIENKIVYDKNTNEHVTDEDIILRVKSSFLIYKEAKKAYKSDISQFGSTRRSKEDYITKTMERFGASGEVNTYGVNKVINAILESGGHYEEMISGSDLQNCKFSILVAPNEDYGLAYLRLKLRERGLDISNLRVSQDLTELQHNGVSKVIIDFEIKRLERSASLQSEEATPKEWDSMSRDEQIAHIQARKNEASALQDQDAVTYWNANLSSLQEKNKKEQSSSGDDEPPASNSQPVAQEENANDYYNQLLSAIIRRRTSSNLSDEEKKQIIGEIYYNMDYLVKYINTDQEISSLLMRMIEDLSHDEFEEKIQNQIIDGIKEKLEKRKKSDKSESSIEEQSYDSSVGISSSIVQLKNNLAVLQKEYKTMLSDGYIDDDELTVLINRMDELSNNADELMRSISSPTEMTLLLGIIDNISEEKKKMLQMRNKADDIARSLD